MASEAGSVEGFFKHAQRTGIGRGYRGAADEVAGNRESIGHAPRLTCMPPGGLALGGTNSISRLWSQLFAGELRVRNGPRSRPADRGRTGCRPTCRARRTFRRAPTATARGCAQSNGSNQVESGSRSENMEEQAGDEEERNDPPAAPVAIVQPLDRGREIDPEEQRRAERLQDQGRRDRRMPASGRPGDRPA